MVDRYTILEVENLIREFVSILDEIYRRETVRLNWRDIMFNRDSIGVSTNPQNVIERRGLLYRYHKQFIALGRAIQLYALLTQSLERFKQEKERIAQEIQPLDLELSNRIRYFNVPSIWELEWLKPIVEMFNKNSEQGIIYIKTHSQEIVQKLNAFNDRRTAYELSRTVHLLTGEEVVELNKCINDTRRWPNYRLTNRIEFFTQRLLLYLRGGLDKVSDENYIGLASHFKDTDLARQMIDVPEIKKLWTYKQEMEFFSWARYVIMKSIREEGKWEGFYEFYNNLRRGKNYIKMVSEKFGNEEFAAFLERLHEKRHEAPEIWGRDLAELNHKLNNPTYQNMYVIEPARQALINVFTSRINELLAARSGAVNKLQGLLNVRVRELENAKTTTQNKFGKMLKRYRRKIMRKWENEKNEYENREDSAIFPLVNFNEMAQKVLSRIDRKKIYVKYKMVLNYGAKGNLFLAKLLETMSGNESNEFLLEKLEGRALYALYKRYELAKAEYESLNEIETIESSDLEELKRLIALGRKIILPNLDKLLVYIYSKVDQYCTPEVRNLLKQYPTETGQLKAA